MIPVWQKSPYSQEYADQADAERNLASSSPIDSPQMLEQVENYLKKISSMLENGEMDKVYLKSLKAGNTTQTSWKVKLRCNGATVANLKCSYGNTYAPAEIAKYKLGKAVGFNISPVSLPTKVNLEGVNKNGPTDCTIKMWSGPFAQLYFCGRDGCGNATLSTTSNKLGKMTRRLTSCGDGGEGEQFTWKQKTRFGFLGNPSKYYIGTRWVNDSGVSSDITADQVARDFSNMMVFDALTGEADRGPGGNVHFRDQKLSYFKSGSKVVFPYVRLFALDNGSGFKSESINTHGMNDLVKWVKRYDRETLERIDQFLQAYPQSSDRFLDVPVKKGDMTLYEFVKSAFVKVMAHASSSRNCTF